MNCDDFMLLVAKEGTATPAMGEHLQGCEACRELQRLMDTDGDGGREARTADEEIIGQEIGPYRVTKLLGAGGMGRVYLGVHPEIGSRVAVKVFSKDWNQHPSLVARFFAEARATNLIGHENIVNVLDVGRLDDGRPYMVMEHLPGVPLSELIGTETLTDTLVIRLMLEVLSALSAAHGHKIVHRDLKPDNIFVSPEGRATLLDFGVAKLVPEAVPGSAPTATGTVIGTPHYMSPEQATGDPVDTRSDVYAMGVMLYECFTGRRPFEGTSLYRLMDQQVHVVPTRPREIRPELSESIDELIMKAMEKSPAKRFATPDEMHQALSASQVGDGSSASAAAAWKEQDQAPTSATVAERPLALRKEEEEESASAKAEGKRSSKRWVGAVAVLLSAAAVSLFIASGASKSSQSASAPALPVVTARDAALPLAPVLDASQDAAALPNAAPVDAAHVDAAPAVPATIKKAPAAHKPKLGGTAPLSLLAESTRLVTARTPDAALAKIIINGLNEEGRVDLNSEYAEITFDFISPRLAFKAAGTKRSPCIERVIYKSSTTPTIVRKTAECANVRVIAPPRCTMKKLLIKGRAHDGVPAQGTATRVYLMVPERSTSGRGRWKLEFGHRSFSVSPC